MNEVEYNPLIARRFRGFLPVVVDVETAGFDARTDALLEIAAVILHMDEAGQIHPAETHACHVEPFPGANLDPRALAFNGIDPDHPFRDALPEALKALRAERGERRALTGKARINLREAERSGKLVAELEGVAYAWDGTPVIRELSVTVMRGDRIGIIGRNGCGKSTLLNLILGRLQPQGGHVRLGTRLEVAYFDQLRAALDEELTVGDVVADGSDKVEIDGTTLGAALLAPTRIYVQSLLALHRELEIHALAHITGGGLPENLPRVLPQNTKAVIDAASWRRPEVFNWIQRHGNVAEAEMLRTLNCGVGMVVCVAEADAGRALALLEAHG
ncbi:MAG: hypothetical protein B0D90_01505, partial [Candidatus Sedimenticola endophacoides]